VRRTSSEGGPDCGPDDSRGRPITLLPVVLTTMPTLMIPKQRQIAGQRRLGRSMAGAVVDRGTQILGEFETVKQPSLLCFRLMDSSNVPWYARRTGGVRVCSAPTRVSSSSCAAQPQPAFRRLNLDIKRRHCSLPGLWLILIVFSLRRAPFLGPVSPIYRVSAVRSLRILSAMSHRTSAHPAPVYREQSLWSLCSLRAQEKTHLCH